MQPATDVAQRPGISVTKVTFSDGSNFAFGTGDIVVFVGPNNSGKSVALAEIYSAISIVPEDLPGSKVVKGIDLERRGTEEDIIDFLEKVSVIVRPDEPNQAYAGLGYQIAKAPIRIWWKTRLHGLRELFCSFLTTQARLSACSPPGSIQLTAQAAEHPIHVMQRDDEEEKRISKFFRQAFGEDLVVHRNAGGNVPLYCGVRPIVEGTEDRASLSYSQKVERLDRVDVQGDGIKSFVGVVLYALLASRNVLLVDEPEAFLHPPQARILGKMLASELPATTQMFCATHSGDFLRGLLDRDKGNVHVVRIRRTNNTNIVRSLDKLAVKGVWSDPLLRYSNILDGVFHRGVVVCESDSDCRFYAAVADARNPGSEPNAELDLMFTHCGGKHRIPMVLKALAGLEVPFAAVVDFDVLREAKLLQSLFESCGGDWNLVEKDWQTLSDSIDAKKPELSTKEVVKEISGELSSASGTVFPKTAIDKIQKILRRGSPWAIAKSVGVAFVPPGEATKAHNRLVTQFAERGLFVVPVGELEGFARSVGDHGPGWVTGVLEQKNLATDEELLPARNFTDKFVRFVLK